MSKHFAIALISAHLMLLTPDAQAAEATSKEPVSAQPSATPDKSQPRSGLKARIDQETGELADPEPESRHLNVTTPDSPFGRRNNALMWTETLGDGSLLLHTEGQVQMATFARFRDNGSSETYCGPVATDMKAKKDESK